MDVLVRARRRAFGTAVGLVLGALSARGEVLAPARSLMVDPPLSVDDDEATNVSGAACYVRNGERKSCLRIGDEVKYARLFSIEESVLKPGAKVFLLPERDPANKKFKETDAEGVAFAEGHYYVVGSHGLDKKGAKQASRYFVFRIRVDPDTGRPSDLGTTQAASSSVERSKVLEDLIGDDAVSLPQTQPLTVAGESGDSLCDG